MHIFLQSQDYNCNQGENSFVTPSPLKISFLLLLPSCQSLATTNLFVTLTVLPFLKCHVNGVIQYVSGFCHNAFEIHPHYFMFQ